MDAMVWLALVSALAAVSSAVFAFVQAKAATDSRKDADDARDEAREARDESKRLASEANSAFIRQAEAQEEANQLKIKEMTPPDWSGPTWVAGESYRMTNTSGATLVVSDYDVQPDGTEAQVMLDAPDDGVYAHGSSFRIIKTRGFGALPDRLVLRYRAQGEDGPLREFIVPL